MSPRPSTPPEEVEHGTYAGAIWHKAHRVPLCDPCQEAQNEYMREWRKTPEGKAAIVRQHARDRARRRAFNQLASRYPDEFTRLFDVALGEETR